MSLVRRVVLVCLVVFVSPLVAYAADPAQGALAKYVAQPDATYQWSVRSSGTIGATPYSELILTSQTWREVIWKHQLVIFKPASAAQTKHALLFIAGGSWKQELEQPPADETLPEEGEFFARLAGTLGTPVAVLLHVPHQPIFDGKKEDAAIAFTFQKYLETGDDSWPLLLPMAKSAVRAMDAVTEHAAEEWSLDVETFTVSGGSKRGWTTWLTGAVDQRVTAIAPIVIDVLNMRKQMDHQREAWGDLSYKINDYSERGLDRDLDSPRQNALRQIVDPYSYRDKLTVPKLIVIGTNDHYWPLDALNLYWDDLSGPKHILYVPNNRHGIKDLTRLTASLNALHQQAARGMKLPKLQWCFDSSAAKLRLHVTSDIKPVEVTTWVATSATRDFRQAKWESQVARRNGDDYLCEAAMPSEGYAAMFGEAVYEARRWPYYLSTNVRIVKAATLSE